MITALGFLNNVYWNDKDKEVEACNFADLNFFILVSAVESIALLYVPYKSSEAKHLGVLVDFLECR